MGLRAFGLAAALFLLCVCSDVSAAKKAGALKPTEEASTFVIERDATFDVKLGIGAKWRWGLHAGTYVATFENDEGVFYEGTGSPVISYLGERSMGDYAGGIFVPRATPDSPYLYYYFKHDEDTYRSAGAVVAWMIKSGDGKIMFFPYKEPLKDPAFLAMLKSSFRTVDETMPTGAGSP